MSDKPPFKVDVYYGSNRYDGWRPPFTKPEVYDLEIAGYRVRWDDFYGTNVAWVEFDTAEEAIMFKLTHYA